jgi:hypothetical protein
MGSTLPTPPATAAVRRACSSRERGPGTSVRILRSCAIEGPPVRVSAWLSVVGAGADSAIVTVPPVREALLQ